MDCVSTRQRARLAERSNQERSQHQPHLPTDIWARIVAQLSMQDMARACGTCKAFHAVQPQAMYHRRHGWGHKKLSEVIWGLRHGREAEIMWLDFWWSETQEVRSTAV